MIWALRAVDPGPHVTIQDAGRRGWRRFGVAGSGAMDIPSLMTANTLVGNNAYAAALEFAHVGGSWEVLADACRIAVTGGDFSVTAGGVPLRAWRSHLVHRGQRLVIRGARDAVWGYLAVAGGLRLAPQLGSCATHIRFRIGGFSGRPVRAGDVLPLARERVPEGVERRASPPVRSSEAIRVVLGPQAEYFTENTIKDFFAASYRVTHRSDRMGTWLEGPHLAHADGFNVISDGIVPGCIQVPGAGQPVVLMMDCQTIGGYPKLATVVTADLPRFAQCRPGNVVHFRPVGIEEAQKLYRAYCEELRLLEDTAIEIPSVTERPFWLLQ